MEASMPAIFAEVSILRGKLPVRYAFASASSFSETRSDLILRDLLERFSDHFIGRLILGLDGDFETSRLLLSATTALCTS